MIRYALLILPAVISIYVYPYPDDEMFILHFLLLLFLVTLGFRMPKSLSAPVSVAELLYTAWLCYQYGSLMIFPAISALLCYSRLQPKQIPLVFFIVHLAVLNMAFRASAPLEWISQDLIFLVSACLNQLLVRSGRGREDTLFLYDELRKKHFELEEARSRLLQFTSQVENAASANERIRIARQLHDDIGHRLIRIKMMADAAVHTLPLAPENGREMVTQIRDQLSASMEEMRAAVRRINYAPQLEGAYALDRLLEEIGRDTGIKTSYSVQGLPYPLYPSVQVVLYNNAREAITNALRHGKASEVWIRLTYSEREVIMEVENSGILPEGEQLLRLERGGMGMKGMKERTAMIGGTLELRVKPHFSVVTRLPVYKQGEIV